jgi:hypothetical protein
MSRFSQYHIAQNLSDIVVSSNWRTAVFHEHEVINLLKDILRRVERIEREIAPKSTASVVNLFSGESNMNNALVFTVGQTSTDTVTPFLADGVTPSGATITNLAVVFSDPSATASVSGANTILFTAVAPSTGPVSGTTTCTLTDTDGVVSTWSIPFTVTTNSAPPPPSQLTQSVVNVFSEPA